MTSHLFSVFIRKYLYNNTVFTAIVSLKLAEPQFEGQTKTKLGNSEIKGFVDSTVTSALTEFFEENPTVAKAVVTTLGPKGRNVALDKKWGAPSIIHDGGIRGVN